MTHGCEQFGTLRLVQTGPCIIASHVRGGVQERLALNPFQRKIAIAIHLEVLVRRWCRDDAGERATQLGLASEPHSDVAAVLVGKAVLATLLYSAQTDLLLIAKI